MLFLQESYNHEQSSKLGHIIIKMDTLYTKIMALKLFSCVEQKILYIPSWYSNVSNILHVLTLKKSRNTFIPFDSRTHVYQKKTAVDKLIIFVDLCDVEENVHFWPFLARFSMDMSIPQIFQKETKKRPVLVKKLT